MSFDRAFRNSQNARDFGVIAPLEKEIDDLLLPAPHSVEPLFHESHLLVCATFCLDPSFGGERRKRIGEFGVGN